MEDGPQIIVRTEEVLIVGVVLILWVGAIVLFFNRWGKIRMLEPYQPKFQQQHRPSCPLDMDMHQRSSVSRMSMGMGMSNQVNIPSCQFAAYSPSMYAKGYTSHLSCLSYGRPRQNSVFVGPSQNFFLPITKAPQRCRSAMDLHTVHFDEVAEQV